MCSCRRLRPRQSLTRRAVTGTTAVGGKKCCDCKPEKEIKVEVVEKEVIKEVKVEVIKEVPKEVIKYVEVEVPVEVIREVVKTVEVPVEVIVEKVVEKEKKVTVEVPVQIIREVPVEVVKEKPCGCCKGGCNDSKENSKGNSNGANSKPWRCPQPRQHALRADAPLVPAGRATDERQHERAHRRHGQRRQRPAVCRGWPGRPRGQSPRDPS